MTPLVYDNGSALLARIDAPGDANDGKLIEVTADAAGRILGGASRLRTFAATITASPQSLIDLAPAWVTATAYVVDDLVKNGGKLFACIAAHTSGATGPTATNAQWVRIQQLRKVTIYNGSAGAIYVGGANVSTSSGIPIAASAYAEEQIAFPDSIYFVAGSSLSGVRLGVS